jgi:hypothetical protein
MPPGGGGAVPRIEDPPLPPAYLPTATVKSFAVASPTKALAAGSFQLTPARCSGAGCSGFRVSNTPDYSSRVNAATFAPAPKPLQVRVECSRRDRPGLVLGRAVSFQAPFARLQRQSVRRLGEFSGPPAIGCCRPLCQRATHAAATITRATPRRSTPGTPRHTRLAA